MVYFFVGIGVGIILGGLIWRKNAASIEAKVSAAQAVASDVKKVV